VTETGVLPPIPATTGPPPIPPDGLEQTPRLGAAVVAPAIVRVRQPGTLAVLVEEAVDHLTITLERRKGKRWLAVGDVLERDVPVGLAVIALPSLAKKGVYRVRVNGRVDTLETRFKVRRAAPARRAWGRCSRRRVRGPTHAGG
jgi:hypothetical protein